MAKNNLSELFWESSLTEMKQGYRYIQDREEYVCLLCGASFQQEEIYPVGSQFYTGRKRMKIHIEEAHGSVFSYLMNLDKKYTGLTEVQKNLLTYFFAGHSDQEIVRLVDGGSASTIRNHRFMLREKKKQAKVFLAIMELLEGKPEMGSKLVEVHRTATMVDERYATTEAEEEKILKAYFPNGLEGPLSSFPTKEKRKIIVLKNIIGRFEGGREYSEKEINAVLKGAHEDYVTLRRYLIEYGYMDRVKDGSRYWVKA